MGAGRAGGAEQGAEEAAGAGAGVKDAHKLVEFHTSCLQYLTLPKLSRTHMASDEDA